MVGPHLPHAVPAAASLDVVAFFTLVREWTVHLAATNHADSTRGEYEYVLLKFFSQVLVDPGELSELDVEAYIANRRHDSPGWCRQVVKVLRAFYRYTRRRGIFDIRPADEVRPPREPEPDPDSLTYDEFQRAIFAAAAVLDPRAPWSSIALLETGARISSMAAVRPEETPTAVGERIHFAVAKGNRPYSVRITPLGFIAFQELLRLHEPNRYDTLIGVHQDTLWRWWHRAARLAGLSERKWRTHILRDTFVNNHIDRDIPVDVVAKLVNHKSAETTLRHYVRTRDERVDAAMDIPSSFGETIAAS